MNDDQLIAETIATYDEVAPEFARLHWDAPVDQQREAFARAIVGAAPAERFRILDAGCGPGRDTRWFHERGFQVVGVDLSAGMLAEARRRARASTFARRTSASWTFPRATSTGSGPRRRCSIFLEPTSRAFSTSFNRLLGHGYLYLSVKAGQGDEVTERGYGPGHRRRFTYFSRPEIELLVERAGFDVHSATEDEPTAINPGPWISILAQTKLRTPLLGAIAVIFDEQGRVLLSERADGRGWNLPAGFVDGDESPEEAAVRETREETGLEVVVERLIGIYTTVRRPRPVGPPVQGTLVTNAFLCRQVGGSLVLTNEALQHGWFAPGAFPSPMSSQRHLDIVQDAIALRSGARSEAVVRRYR